MLVRGILISLNIYNLLDEAKLTMFILYFTVNADQLANIKLLYFRKRLLYIIFSFRAICRFFFYC